MADECRGQLKGDPDIAGTGVVAALLSTTIVAVLFSWLLWYRVLFLGESTRTSARYRALLKCAFGIADVQLVTALAIVLSSVKLIRADPDTSLYHVFVARMLAQANLNGHGSTLVFDTRRQANWKLRLALVAACEVAYVYLTVITVREFEGWDDTTPRCFHNDDNLVPGRYTHWMYVDVVWMLVGSVWPFAEAVGIFEKRLRDFDHYTINLVKGVMRGLMGLVRNLVHGRLVAALFDLVMAAFRAFLWVSISLFIMPPSATPFASTFFVAWNCYDVWMVRSSNSHIMVAFPDQQGGGPRVSLYGNENPEHDMGFGQLLPIFLLILPILQVWDNFVESGKSDGQTSLMPLSREVSSMLRSRGLRIVQEPSGRRHDDDDGSPPVQGASSSSRRDPTALGVAGKPAAKSVSRSTGRAENTGQTGSDLRYADGSRKPGR